MSLIIIFAGGTASGKTTIAKAFAKSIEASIISHDRYYKDVENPIGHNYDEPAALDNQLLAKNLRTLKKGLPTELPVYHFPTHRRQPHTETMHPTPYIIVEGILTFSCPEILSLGDICVYVEAPADIRLARRIKRDAITRGRSIESVIDQYLNTVRPMHEKHIKPLKNKASLILDGCQPIAHNMLLLNQLVKQYSTE